MSSDSVRPGQGRGVSLSWLYEAAGALLVLTMGGLTAVDVFGRYVLSKPVFGAFDMVEALMAVSIFWFLPSVSRSSTHISLGLLNLRPGSLAERLRQAVVELSCVAAASVLAFQLFHAAADHAARGEASLILQIPTSPLIYACAAFSTIVAGVHGWRLLSVLTGRVAAPTPGESS